MKKFFFTLFVFLVITTVLNAQTGTERLKAVFIYNFTKQIQWPTSYRQGDFVIGVLGNASIVETLHQIAETKKTGTQEIRIEVYRAVSDINNCHILFIPFNYSSRIDDVVNQITNQSTLIVSEKIGLVEEGAGINFLIYQQKLSFELSQENIEKYDLKIANTLLQLAAKVY